MDPPLQFKHNEKAEQKRIRKRDHMRKKRKQLKHTFPSSKLSPDLRAQRKKLQDRLAQRRRRLKQRLLSPTFHLCNPEDMDRVKSWFALHAEDTEYVLHLPPWEIYSSKLGSVYLHSRQVLDETGVQGPSRTPHPTDYDPAKNWVEIPHYATQFLDAEKDLLHVVRNGSPILEKVTSNRVLKDPIYYNGNLDINFSLIVNALLSTRIGAGDTTRSPDAIRVSFGFNEYSTPTAFGSVEKFLNTSNAMAFKKEVGRIAEFLCAVMICLQAKSDNEPIWINPARDTGFAAVIRKRLHLPKISPMRAEMVVVSLMPLTQFHPINKEHLDPKNPKSPHYNRNGTFSAVVKGEDGHLYLLQVLVASRKYAVKVGKKGLH